MRFTTQSGSTYEIDAKNKKIRRLNGSSDPTPRQGKDGEWRSYKSIHPTVPTLGKSVIVCWSDDVKPMIKGAIPTTVTSPIVSIVSNEEIN